VERHREKGVGWSRQLVFKTKESAVDSNQRRHGVGRESRRPVPEIITGAWSGTTGRKGTSDELSGYLVCHGGSCLYKLERALMGEKKQGKFKLVQGGLLSARLCSISVKES